MEENQHSYAELVSRGLLPDCYFLILLPDRYFLIQLSGNVTWTGTAVSVLAAAGVKEFSFVAVSE
ncbi:MAG: hypothetical protein WAK56_24435 [Candidatus Sulfotelmatobacter sp.]